MNDYEWGVMNGGQLDLYSEEDARALALEDPAFYTLWHRQDHLTWVMIEGAS